MALVSSNVGLLKTPCLNLHIISIKPFPWASCCLGAPSVPLIVIFRCHAPRFWLPTLGGHADTRTCAEKQLLLVIKNKLHHLLTGSGGRPWAPSIQPALTPNARELRHKRSCGNYQPSNTVCNNAILIHTDLMAIQLHQHGPVCSNLCLFNRKAHPKNADWLQRAISSNYPSPRSLFSSREQSLLTLSYKIAFCQRRRRY